MLLIQSTEIIINVYIFDCNYAYYSTPSDFFIQGEELMKSLDGPTQGNPTAMVMSALVIRPLLLCLSKDNQHLGSVLRAKESYINKLI